jgi:hypothetical protein
MCTSRFGNSWGTARNGARQNVGLPNGTVRLLWRLATGATAEHSELTAALPRVVIGM